MRRQDDWRRPSPRDPDVDTIHPGPPGRPPRLQGVEPREQAHVPAEQPSPSQGARVPPADAHPCRAGRSCPPGAARAARAWPSERCPACSRHRTGCGSPQDFGTTVRRGRRAGGPLLVVHLLAPAGRAARCARGERVRWVGRSRRHASAWSSPARWVRRRLRNRVQATAAAPRAGARGRPAGGRLRGAAGAACGSRSLPGPGTRCRARPLPPTGGEAMKYVLIGLLRAYRLADQPAVRAGVPLPPALLGVRAGGGHRARQPQGQLAGGAPAGALPPVGRRAATTRCPRAAGTPDLRRFPAGAWAARPRRTRRGPRRPPSTPVSTGTTTKEPEWVSSLPSAASS